MISALGNLTVNGVRYQTTAARVMVNGQAVSVSDLKLGQMIMLDGMINEDGLTGTADGVVRETATKTFDFTNFTELSVFSNRDRSLCFTP